MVKKFSVKEGDWFSVPLRNGGYALGLVARVDKKEIVFSYYFGDRFDSPNIKDTLHYKPSDAILLAIGGYLGFTGGTWSVFGSMENWNRNNWPIPSFYRIDAVDNETVREIVYSGDNLLRPHRETIVKKLPDNFSRDGLWGHKAVEICLSRLIK